jgi:predicted AAA+ superfamily ATPase
MINRTLFAYLQRDATYYPILTLTGPRQSGKSTLAKAAFPHHSYVSLEDLDLRLFAQEDPRGFLNQYSAGVIIDEIQRVPSLFSYLQSKVDTQNLLGRYVLTGSQNFLLMEQVSQTLAGRTAVTHLLPFERAELQQRVRQHQVTASNLFENNTQPDDPWQHLFTGFYPPIHDRAIPPDLWLPDYIRTYIERDVRTLTNIGNLNAFSRFLSLMAGRTGQLLNYSALANECGIVVDTAKRWTSLLVTSFIIFLLPPYHRNYNKRIIKSPKVYFYDPGLVCQLLGIKSPEQARLHPQRGALFENLVISECIKTYTHQRIKPQMYFWRDQTGHEIDLIVEDSSLFAFEIKSGQTLTSDMFSTLDWWTNHTGLPPDQCTLVYAGDQFSNRKGYRVRPWYGM